MNTSPFLRLLAATLMIVLCHNASAQIPQIINYQGRVAVGSPPVNFDGNGQFKFALVNAAGNASYWSNDGTSIAGSEPAASVALVIAKGLYSVQLGDANLSNMPAIPNSVFANADVRLRVWFNDGANGFQLLTPDQRIAAVGYAMMADSVTDGAITAPKIATGAVGGAHIAAGAVGSMQLAANSVQAGNIAAGAVGSSQIAAGAVGASQLTDGSITSDKMVKPVRSGSIPSSSISLAATGGSFTVPFIPPFATVPNVTLTLEAASTSTAATTRVSLTSRTTSQFTAMVSGNIAPATLDVGTSSVGQYSSLAIIAGLPAISYRDGTNNCLIYRRALDQNGTFWGAPVTLDASGNTGEYISLAVINGNPAISYYDSGTDDLKYIRANNSSGTTWGAPVTLDSIGNVGLFTSLAVVNGNPAISYHDLINGDLKYVRAVDASGTTWGAPVTLDSTGDVGPYASLAVVNGNPAISYYDLTNDKLKYLRATDASGTTWGTPVIPDSFSFVGEYTSLMVVNGNPAISYQGNSGLRYVRATDVSGATWGVTVIADSTGPGGQYTSLAVVNGNPAICHFDQPNGDLKYVRAIDANGTTWGTAFAPDTGTNGNVGEYTSHAIVNGNPAISYCDIANSTLKYVRAKDANGMSWADPVTLDSTIDLGNAFFTSLAACRI